MRPSYRPQPAPPPPPSLVQQWLPRALLVAVLATAAYFVWGWLSPALGFKRVGPQPSDGNKVLVLLHGYGASGDDLVSLAEQLSAASPDVTFLVPAGPHRVNVTGRAWLPPMVPSEYATRLPAEVENTSQRVWEVIDYARKKGAECGDIYVGGFSQGGWMAAEVALRGPADCALGGVIVMSGGGVHMDHSPVTGHPRMRVLVTHGKQDSIVALPKGRATAQLFAAGGHDVQWLEFEGPHGIPTAVREAIPGFLRGETVGLVVTAEP